MELYIDFKNVKDKASLAQAIKVFAMTYKEDKINVIVGDEKATLVESDNVKFIDDSDISSLSNLYTVSKDLVTSNMMKLAFLKPSTKEIEAVAFGDLNHNDLTLEERFSLLNKYNLISKSRPLGLLTSSIGLTKEYDEFVSNHVIDDTFIGILKPSEIVSKGVSNILTTTETANIFIDSLYYSVEFLKLKKDDEEKSPNVFQKLFSWNKDETPKQVFINTLIYDFEVYLDDNHFIFVNKDEMNYNYYYQSLCVFYNMLKR